MQEQEQMNGEDPNYNGAQGSYMQYQDDDGYYADEITGTLVETRQNKKKAKDDARLLANRIALLKLEEKKAWKKIQETKKQAD